MIRYLKALAFFLALSFPLVAFASVDTKGNELRDIWVELSSESAAVALELQRPTQWQLWPDRSQGVKLLLKGVSPSQKTEARIIEDATGTLSASVQRGKDFLADFTLRRPLTRVDSSILSEGHRLLFKFYWPKPRQKTKRFSTKAVTLKRIRYGRQRGFDRIVMELSAKPLWQIRWTDPRHLAVVIKRCNFRRIRKPRRSKILKDVRAKMVNNETIIELVAAQDTASFRVFWLEVGDRLVVDIMFPQAAPLVALRGLPEDFGRAIVRKPPEVAEAQDHSPQRFKPFEINVLEGQRQTLKPKVVKKIPKANTNGRPSPQMLKEKSPAKLSKAEALAYGRIMGALNFKEYEKGVRLIESFLKRFPNSPIREKLLFMKGEFYLHKLELGHPKMLYATLNSFKKFIQLYPHSPLVPKAYLKMARASRLGGDYYGAMGYLNLLFERYRGGQSLPSAYLERAMVYNKLQLADKTFEDFNTVVRRFPYSAQSAMARFGIAKYLHNKGLYEEAEKWLHEIEVRNPEFPTKHPAFFMIRAKNDLYLKRFSRARELFLKALNLGDDSEPIETVLTRVGDTYLYEGQKDRAKKIYTFVVTHFPESESVSIAQLRLADLSSGIEKFKKLHERYGESPLGELALLKLAGVYFRNKAYDKAMDALREMVVRPAKDEAGKTARALFFQALEEAIEQAYNEGRFEQCIALYEKNKALTRGQLATGTRLYLAQALFKTGAAKEALRVLGPFDPNSLAPGIRPQYIMVYAKALKAAGDTEKAIGIVEQQRHKLGDARWKAECSLFLAKAYQETGQLSKALIEYEKIEPQAKNLEKAQRIGLWMEMGRLNNKMGHALKAREALNRALNLMGKGEKYRQIRLVALIELAKTYSVQGSPAEAARILRSILDQGYGPREKHYWDVKFRLARCYEQMGEKDKAKALYKEIGDEGPPILQARAQMRLGSIVLNERLKELPHWAEVASR